jgi:hypothetical protein
MVRFHHLLLAFSLSLVVCQLAYGRSPDQVVNSPIPPLKEPAARQSVRSRAIRPRNDRILPSLPLPKRVVIKPRNSAPTEEATRVPEDYLTEQTEIWNSPAMGEARSFVMEFSRRSAQTSAEEGDRFIQQLSVLSPSEMKSWLKRYQELRTKIALEREVEQFARQLMVEYALTRQEAMRQAFDHVSQLRAQATVAAQMQQQGIAVQSDRLNRGELILVLRPTYNPMSPVIDPAMRKTEEILRVPIAQAAAAASLPGDLPRDDPRNYDPHAGGDGE